MGRLGGRGVAALSCPPEHAATSNLGQAELKGDARFGACEKQAVGIRRRPRDSVHVLGDARACFFSVDVPLQPQQLPRTSRRIWWLWLVSDCQQGKGLAVSAPWVATGARGVAGCSGNGVLQKFWRIPFVPHKILCAPFFATADEPAVTALSCP